MRRVRPRRSRSVGKHVIASGGAPDRGEIVLGNVWTRMRETGAPTWWASFALVVVLALVGYGFILQPGQVLYSPHSDILAYHLGAKGVLWRSLEAGRGIPFWRADQMAGGPAFTSPNALYTYPLHGLFYLLNPPAAVDWTMWIHIVLGALVFWELGRALGLGSWPRLLMAVAALFNFKVLMAVYAGWLSLLPGISFFPLLFAVLFRLADHPRARDALALAAVGALCLHGGHVQLVYYCSWFLAAYVLIALFRLWRAGSYGDMRRVAGWAALSGALAVGMAAYLLVPLAAEVPLVTRDLASREFFRSFHSLGWHHLLTFFHPELLGSPRDGTYAAIELWEDVAYFGLVPLLLAFAGGTLGWRRPRTRFLVVSFVVSMLFALDTPLVRFLYDMLPGFRLFRLPGRMLFLTSCFGIALAGVGLEEVLARLRGVSGAAWRTALAAGAMIAVIVAEGAYYSHRYLATIAGEYAAPKTDYARFLAADPEVFRVAPLGSRVVPYGWAAPMGLQMISGYEPFNLRHYQEYDRLMQFGDGQLSDAITWTDFTRIARWDLFDNLNVRYVLTPSPLRPLPERLELVAQYQNQPLFVLYRGMYRTNVFIYRNTEARPRVSWVSRVVPASGEKDATALIRRHDLRDLAIVDGAEATEQPGPVSSAERAEVVAAADGFLEVETESPAKRFLVISEVWHPGWSATMDGVEHRLHRTNLALMGAWMPAGKHRLVLRFRPLLWRPALAVSLGSGVAFLGLAAIAFLQRRRDGHGLPTDGFAEGSRSLRV